MFSKQAATKKLGAREGFYWRGQEVSRLEGLSDAVFAFAVTLLIVSTEVPKTYNDLIFKLQDFVPFAACFVQLMAVWYRQYQYYRRYGLQDMTSIVLTMALLFVILFYTYPLKFVFMAFWLSLTRGVPKGMFDGNAQVSELFTIYAIGFIAVYVVFVWMYLHAYRHRKELKLTELEIWDTKHELREMIMFCGVGLISLTLANVLPSEDAGFAGMAYSLLGVVGGVHGTWSGNRRKEIHARLYPAHAST
jgi:uncharacterized membrane protein